MKSGLIVLILLVSALVLLPLAPPAGSSTAASVQAPATAGVCQDCSGGQGMQGALSGGRHGMMAGAGPAMPDNGNGRRCHESPAGSQVRDELRRDPFDWNSPVRAARFRGFRRLCGKNILENGKRQSIHAAILANPGIEIATLSATTGINLHTLRYHLEHLLRTKKVACVEQGGRFHFFENHGRYDPAGQQRILYARYPTTSRILSAINTTPGITRGEIADELGIAGPSVTRWARRLIAEGIVREVRNGRQVQYFPVQEAATTSTPAQPLA